MNTNVDDLLILLTVSRSSTFTTAGRALGLSHTTVSRRIAALEKALGGRVLVREAGSWDLTELGAAAVAAAEQIQAAVEELKLAGKGPDPITDGVHLTMTAGEGISDDVHESSGMDRGLAIRRQVMGDAFVQKALNRAVDTPAWPLQEHITEHVWGGAWSRDGLDRRSRSIVTLSILVALRAHEELPGHVRGALTNGLKTEEIAELLIHASAYCGAPAALSAMRAVESILSSPAS